MNMQLTRKINEDEIRAYERDGVIWLQSIIDPEWAYGVEAAAARLAADPPASTVDFTNLGLAADDPSQIRGFCEGAEWSAADVDWGVVSQLAGNVLMESAADIAPQDRGHYLSIARGWTVDPFFESLALRSPVVELAALLMRSPRVNLYSDQLLIKPPMTLEKTAWHHDLSYNHIEGEQVCAIRVPATEETFEMGAVRYWRGSHRDGTIYKVNFFISDKAAQDDPGAPYPDLDGSAQDYDIVYFEPRPGDLIVHHLRTVHGAGGNMSRDRSRCAVTLRYAGEDVIYKFRHCAPPQGTMKLTDGDPLDADPARFPRVWPRGHA